MKEPPRKNFAEAQVFKRCKLSRVQGSLLPGTRQAEEVNAEVVVPAVDVETPGNEVADVDTVTARAEIDATNVDLLEQTFSSGEEVTNHGVNHNPSSRRFLIFREESLLIVPCLRCRVGDGFLADQLPADFTLVLGERLLVVPVLRVKQGLIGLLLDDATDVEDRQREYSDENVRVLAGRKHFLAERNFGQVGELLLRGVNPEVFDRFLDAEEVLAHDLAGELL